MGGQVDRSSVSINQMQFHISNSNTFEPLNKTDRSHSYSFKTENGETLKLINTTNKINIIESDDEISVEEKSFQDISKGDDQNLSPKTNSDEPGFVSRQWTKVCNLFNRCSIAILHYFEDRFGKNIKLSSSQIAGFAIESNDRVVKLFMNGRLSFESAFEVYDRINSVLIDPTTTLAERTAASNLLATIGNKFSQGKNRDFVVEYAKILKAVANENPENPNSKFNGCRSMTLFDWAILHDTTNSFYDKTILLDLCRKKYGDHGANLVETGIQMNAEKVAFLSHLFFEIPQID